MESGVVSEKEKTMKKMEKGKIGHFVNFVVCQGVSVTLEEFITQHHPCDDGVTQIGFLYLRTV